MSMRREKFVTKGGPDGGDGGRGADVVLVADRNRSTLMDFKYQREIRAPDGRHGAGRRKTGASGQSVYIPVPMGTIFPCSSWLSQVKLWRPAVRGWLTNVLTTWP